MEQVIVTPAFWQRLWRHRLARWPLRYLAVLAVVALLADLLANDRPLVCRCGGAWYFPVFRTYAGDGGASGWKERACEWALWPPVRYRPTGQDLPNALAGPFRSSHWLGTDHLGRDTAAGMIAGSRTALFVGLIVVLIAAFIGLLLGGVAGFFGDRAWTMPRGQLLLLVAGLAAAVYYGWVARSYALLEQGGAFAWLCSIGITVLLVGVFGWVGGRLSRWGWASRPVAMPADLLVMRLIEIINAIPRLLLLLSVMAVVSTPSLWYVVLVLGLLSWTGIAKFVRAELLRIRELTYIEAVRALGLPEGVILLRHALPNALPPALITLAFGAASAILAEATLSFLGIGVAPEDVTWGSMLNAARDHFSAWWLALFPGLGIFATVLSLNLLGEALGDLLQPKLKA